MGTQTGLSIVEPYIFGRQTGERPAASLPELELRKEMKDYFIVAREKLGECLVPMTVEPPMVEEPAAKAEKAMLVEVIQTDAYGEAAARLLKKAGRGIRKSTGGFVGAHNRTPM